jgi:trk system potassium uptake protein TrkH
VRQGGFAVVAAPLLVAMLMLGGGGFSTAGGIKFYRLGAMLNQAAGELARLIHPHGVRGARFGGQTYDLQVMKAIWSGSMAYVGAVAATLMLLALFGESFDQGLIAAVAALSNAGPVYTGVAAAEGWAAYGQMEPAYLAVITVAMIVGRLEVIAVFALFNPLYWRS